MDTCSETMWPVYVPKGNLITWSVVCSLLTPVIVTLNLILIFIMFKTGEKRSYTSHFVICMSISDIGMGSIALPMLVAMLTVENLRSNCTYQRVVQCVAYIFGYTTFFMLIVIAMDRYLLITKTVKYKSIMTKFRFGIVVTCVVMTAIACSVISVTLYSFYLHMAFISTNVLFIGSIYILYNKLLHRIDKQASTVAKSEVVTSTRERLMSKKSRRRKRDVSVARTIKILLSTIFGLYMPYNIVSSIWTYYRFQLNENPGLILNITVFWTYVLMFINCTANVIIYGHGNGKIRRYARNTLLRRFGDGSLSVSKSSGAGDTDSENTRFDEKTSQYETDTKRV